LLQPVRNTKNPEIDIFIVDFEILPPVPGLDFTPLLNNAVTELN
jgi:hypothetical protein